MKKNKILHVVLCSALLLVFLHPLYAAESAARGRVPTSVNSARMDYDADAQIVTFSGNVYVKRPDFELWAAKMTVYLDKSGKKPADADAQGMEAGEIDRITAEGNVRMKSEGRQGTCERATYYARQDKFVMEGAPRLQDGKQSVITGSTIVHYFSNNHSEVLNNAGVIFYTPEKTDNTGPRSMLPVNGGKGSAR
ncbi:MAG: LptA/OstA family protein [Desulfovibrio sp.]|jgi:lipopolysaccharide export system protein LptA|nr:LptA/OstA family protein [Desulfovibrio sp.]